MCVYTILYTMQCSNYTQYFLFQNTGLKNKD